jgi:hypothetical protein
VNLEGVGGEVVQYRVMTMWKWKGSKRGWEDEASFGFESSVRFDKGTWIEEVCGMVKVNRREYQSC